MRFSRKVAEAIVLLTILVLGARETGAEKIYTYDTDGGLLFTDRTAGNGKLLDVAQAEAYEPKNRLDVRKIGTDDDFEVEVYNEYYGPVEISFRFDKSENMSGSHEFPQAFVVGPRQRTRLFKLWRNDSRRGYAYTYTQMVVLGDPRAEHAPGTLYALPIWPEDAGTVRLSQAFDGKASHLDVQNRHAIDIPAAEGTPVRVARAGIVMDIAADYFRSGTVDKYKDRANFVRILHDDGTMGLYAHLQLESVRVRLGERVQAGQLLAKAGSTGYSGGPHLHFVVQKNFGGELRSVPFVLAGGDGSGIIPREGLTFPSGTAGRY